jgi:hypothetical protein
MRLLLLTLLPCLALADALCTSTERRMADVGVDLSCTIQDSTAGILIRSVSDDAISDAMIITAGSVSIWAASRLLDIDTVTIRFRRFAYSWSTARVVECYRIFQPQGDIPVHECVWSAKELQP